MSSVRVPPDVIAAAQTGDREALDTIACATYSYVKGFAVRRASDYAYAEEAVQEAYLAMLSCIANYQPRAPIEQWLCGIARNRLAHIERRERLRVGPVLRADMAIADDIEQQVLDRLSDEQIARLLSMLTAYQRVVLSLRFIAGLDTEAAADLLDVSRSSVKYATHHGLRRLRQRFGDEAAYHRRQNRSDR